MDHCVRIAGQWVVNNTRVTPLALTLWSFVISIGSAICFLTGDFWLVILGVATYQVSNVLDALDGMVARARPGSGSPFALAADHTLDPWRLVLNLTAVGWAVSQRDETGLPLLLAALFLAMHFSDWIQPRFTAAVRARYQRRGALAISRFDTRLLSVKDGLERCGLRVIFFSVHEREVLVLGIGPLFALEQEMFMTASILTALFLVLRFRLDIAILRDEFATGRPGYLGDADNFWERGLPKERSADS